MLLLQRAELCRFRGSSPLGAFPPLSSVRSCDTPRRPSDQHAEASRRLGTACGGCRKRVSSGHNLSVPAPFNWATSHPKFQAPVTRRLVPET